MDVFIKDLSRRRPVTGEAVEAFEKMSGMKLPSDYVEFLETTDGGDGFIGDSAYVILWGVEELLSMNQAYEVQSHVPGLLLFGSDGGGEAYGFDARTGEWRVVRVPFVGMAWELARPMGASFREFLEALYRMK